MRCENCSEEGVVLKCVAPMTEQVVERPDRKSKEVSTEDLDDGSGCSDHVPQPDSEAEGVLSVVEDGAAEEAEPGEQIVDDVTDEEAAEENGAGMKSLPRGWVI